MYTDRFATVNYLGLRDTRPDRLDGNHLTIGINHPAIDGNGCAMDTNRAATGTNGFTTGTHRLATRLNGRRTDTNRSTTDLNRRATDPNQFTTDNFHFENVFHPPTMDIDRRTIDPCCRSIDANRNANRIDRETISIHRNAPLRRQCASFFREPPPDLARRRLCT